MSEAQVGSVSSPSQQPLLSPTKQPGRVANGSVPSPSSEAVPVPAPKVARSEEQNGNLRDAPDGAMESTPKHVKAEEPPEVPTDAGEKSTSSDAADPENPDTQTRARKVSANLGQTTEPVAEAEVPVELAVVKAAGETASERETTSLVRASPPPPPEEDQSQGQGQDQNQAEEQGNDELNVSGTSRQGYGTFEQPEQQQQQGEGGIVVSTVNGDGTSLPSDGTYTRDLSNWMVFTNLMKASMGTGILAMPMAIRNAGYGVGLPMFIVIAVICVYCVHLLVASSRTLRRRLRVQTLEYADTAGAAFKTSRSRVVQCMAPFARGFTEIFLAVYMIGTCSVYVLFVKENLKQLFDVSCQENEWGAIDYLLHLALVLVVLVAIPNLSSLSVVSFIANVTMVVGVVMCLGIICHQINVDNQAPQLAYNRTVDSWSNISVGNVTIEAWAGWDRMPLFFGTAVFALEGIGVVLTLENQMRDPTNFLNAFGVLHIAMFIIAVLYSLMGLLGYLAYGETTKGSITLNLPPDSTLAFWVRKTVTLAIFLTYPLQFYIPEEILWKWLSVLTRATLHVGSYERLINWAGQQRSSQVPRFLFKILLMLATVCLPLAVPRLGPAIALVGAVCLSMLGLILPTIIHAITHWEDIRQNLQEGNMVIKVLFHIVIVIMGLTGLVTGAYSAIEEMNELNAATE